MLVFAFFTCLACKKEDVTIEPYTNKAPVAKAGRDTSIYIPEIAYTLDGGNSFDPDGQYLRYSWRMIKGPDLEYFEPIDNTDLSVVVTEGGQYEFELTVVDPAGLSGRDTVVLNVVDNFAEGKVPVLKLQCKSIKLPSTVRQIGLYANAHVLNDQGQSFDIKTGYSVSQISGPSAMIGDPYLDYPGTAIPINYVLKGTYQFQVSLTRKGVTVNDTATIQVVDDTVQAREYIFETKWISGLYSTVARTPELQDVFFVWPYRKTEVFVLMDGDPTWYQVKANDWFASLLYSVNACNSAIEVLLNEPLPNAEIGRKVTIRVKIS